MDHEEEATCGKGIAANAVFPEKLAAALRGTADVLQNHIRALNPDEASGRAEARAYEAIVAEHRDMARRLDALAHMVREYRDLPMANHDMAILMDKASADAFAAMVDREKDLAALMQDRVREYGDMLDAMRQA